jgi:Protein of unknown function (DUF3667)
MKEIESTDQKQQLKRINSAYLIHEIQHLLHIESGFLYTVKQLLIRPGKLIRGFISEDRTKATKPVIFLIFATTLLTLTFQLSKGEYIFFASSSENYESGVIDKWVNGHIGYASLMMAIFIAFWIALFFWKHKYNIFEITVLLCYTMGQAFLIETLLFFAAFLFKINMLNLLGVYAGYFYVFWATGQFFGEKKIINYIKSALCCFLGAWTFTKIVVLLEKMIHH